MTETPSTLLPIPQEREEWHALRARHIGASEVSALFGCQPDYALGYFALWQVKAGRMPRPEVDNPRTRAGIALEDAISLMAAEQEGWTIQPGVYASHESGLGATLDRIITAPGRNDEGMTGPGVLEIKNVDWLIHRRSWVGGEPPLHITLQLQAQLLATGATWGAVAALVGGNQLEIYRFTARPALHAEMEKRAVAFWSSIKAGQIPNADESDSAWRALVATIAIDKRDEDQALDLSEDEEAERLARQWIEQDAAKKAAEKLADAAKHLLVQRIGAAARARGQGWRVSLIDVKGSEGTLVTPAMVGTFIGGKAGHRRASIKQVAA